MKWFYFYFFSVFLHLIQIQTLKLAKATSSMMTLVMKRMYWRLSSLRWAVSISVLLTELYPILGPGLIFTFSYLEVKRLVTHHTPKR